MKKQSGNRSQRLSALRKVPPFAALDHRLFLNESGQHALMKNLPRDERRKLNAESKRLARKYAQIMTDTKRSGAGYPVDRFLRDLAIEYTHRYAASGLLTQPTSFNYFEPFCAINIIEGSFAPFAKPLDDVDHLFNVADYFDYVTSESVPEFQISDLKNMPSGQVYHFTQNGSINDFTFINSEGREFVVSGFSMVRHGSSLHWFMLGGEVLSDVEWQERIDNDLEIDIDCVRPEKRLFISQVMKENGNRIGAPLALEGTRTAIRTIIAGETDLVTTKHVARCYMTEAERGFHTLCDDPEVFSNAADDFDHEAAVAAMQQRIESVSVMWNLVEGFFQLPAYFQYRMLISKDVIEASNKPKPRVVKGGRGVGARFKYVTSIEVSNIAPDVMRSYTAPYLDVDVNGHWRRLRRDEYGHDREGNPIKGKTWIRVTNNWRGRLDRPRTVYIKSSVAAARIKVSEYIDAAQRTDPENGKNDDGVLYVMRCLALSGEIYKVGWTSNTAEQRARELSAATGVLDSFVVVKAWKHSDAEGLERGVHAMLSPYRINDGREFFGVKYSELETIIETEIERVRRHVEESE